MTATTVRSEGVTNIEASPIVIRDKKAGYLLSVIDQDAVATTSLDEAGDVTLFCPIPSNAVILDVLVLCDDLDVNATETLALDWGLYYSGIGGTQADDGNVSGTVIDADCFAADSVLFDNAITSWLSVRYLTDNIVDIKKEAWEVGGLTADPGGILYIGMNIGVVSATPTAGDVVVRVDYI